MTKEILFFDRFPIETFGNDNEIETFGDDKKNKDYQQCVLVKYILLKKLKFSSFLE